MTRAKQKKKARAAPRKPARAAPRAAVRTAKRAKPAKRPAPKATARKASRPAARSAKKRIVLPVIVAPVEPPKPVIKYPLLPWADTDRARATLSILRELRRTKHIADWKLNLAVTRCVRITTGKAFAIEHESVARREDLLATVYVRLPDGQMGEARVAITDPAEAKAQLLTACAFAPASAHAAFALAAPEPGVSMPDTHDTRIWQAFHDGTELRMARDLVRDARAARDCTVSACDCTLTAATVRVVTSADVDMSFHKTGCELDCSIIAKTQGQEQEFLVRRHVVSLAQLDVRNLLESQAALARDSANAVRGDRFTGDVLLSGQALVEFMTPEGINPLLAHAHARMHALGISRLRMGEPIGQLRGEPFTIISAPHLPLGSLTMPVDEDGVALRPYEIIRNSSMTSYIAPVRDAAMIGVAPTGDLANVQMSPGATREEHLRGNSYIEIVSFSWCNPDPYSGDFSAEIRLGYKWVLGRKTPFRGGTLTGNVFANMLNARFSKEVMQAGRYYGPRAMLFKDALITGF